MRVVNSIEVQHLLLSKKRTLCGGKYFWKVVCSAQQFLINLWTQRIFAKNIIRNIAHFCCYTIFRSSPFRVLMKHAIKTPLSSKKSLQRRYFSENFEKFFKIGFFMEHLRVVTSEFCSISIGNKKITNRKNYAKVPTSAK